MSETKTTNNRLLVTIIKGLGKWLLLPIVALYLLVWAISPLVARLVINDQLEAHSFKLSDNSSIRFNPFILKISLTNIQLIDSSTGKATASIKSAEIDIDSLALFSNQILIETLKISGVDIQVKQSDTELNIAGFPIKQTNSDKTETKSKSSGEDPKNKKATPTWVVLAEKINFDEVNFAFQHLGINHHFTIHSLILNRLKIDEKNQRGKLEIKTSINNSPLKIHFDFEQTNQLGTHQVNFELNDFDLEKIAYLIPPPVEKIAGKLHLKLQQSIALTSEGIRIMQPELNLELNNLKLVATDSTVHNEQLNIQLVDTEVSLLKNKQNDIKLNFFINGKKLQIKQNISQDLLLSYDKINLEKGNFRLDKKQKYVLNIKSFTIQEIVASAIHTIKDKTQPDNKTTLLPPIAKISEVNLSEIDVNDQHLSLNKIKISGLDSTILLDANKQLINLAQLPNKKESQELNSKPNTSEVQQKASNSTKETKEPPPTFSLDQLIITEDSQLKFSDASVSPTFSQHLNFKKLEIGPIDSRDKKIKTNINIDFKTDAYSGAAIQGDILPFSEKVNLNLTSKIREFSLPEVSPYMKKSLGFEMLSGQFDSDIKISIIEDKINGKTKLTMRGLELSSADGAEANSLKDQSAIPLNSALNMLKDSDGNLELDIPLKGNVNAPGFGVSSFITLITKKAVMSAAESYLIDTFVPYANVLSVVRIAGEYMLKVRFEDLEYSPEMIEVQEKQLKFIQQFTTLLKDKPDTQVKVCAIATPQDLPELKPEIKNPEYIEKLRTISKHRGEHFKAWVVEKGKIESSKLLLCQPQIDSSKDAKPRIEFEV
ncbi:DUF748 domain-containing protein [Aliikangiella sp. IMCC44359]|uniref:DUF748 domain-containing protein n=1 Tax=Aliikangiella sp. IMCC44359 TaxID=3459125 RepID=UPI00403B1771